MSSTPICLMLREIRWIHDIPADDRIPIQHGGARPRLCAIRDHSGTVLKDLRLES
jgi:hypothetical protein